VLRLRWSFSHKPSSVLNSIVTAPTQACEARGLDVWCLTDSESVDEAFANLKKAVNQTFIGLAGDLALQWKLLVPGRRDVSFQDSRMLNQFLHPNLNIEVRAVFENARCPYDLINSIN
jgi:hypothetical protein